MQYQEGQQLKGSDGNLYIVSGGVPRLAGGAAPQAAPPQPMAAPQPMVVGTPRPVKPEKPRVMKMGDSLGIVGDDGSFTPTYTAPPKPEKPAAPPKGGDPVTNARNLLTAAGVDLAKGVDPVAGLIKGSTSGGIQAAAAKAYGAVTGDATDGMENIAKLQTIASDLTLQMTGGSLGSQISNADRDFIVQRVGNIADPTVPADARLAAWEQVKQRMANIVGEQYNGSGGLSLEDFQKQVSGIVSDKSKSLEQRLQEALALAKQNGRVLNEEQLQAAIAAGRGAVVEDPNFKPPSGAGDQVLSGAGDVVEGVGDVVGLVTNPLAMGINAVTGAELSTDLGGDLRQLVGLGDGSDSHPLAAAITKGAVGAATGAGGAGVIRGVVQSAAPRAALGTMTAQPGRQMVAGGAAGGSSEMVRQAGAGPLGQAAAGIAGGVGAYGGANALLNAARPRTASPVMAAARAEGIPLRPADVGGRAAKNIDAAAVQSPLSANPVIKAAQNTQDGIQSAVERNARSQGEVMDIDDAGELVRAAGKSYTAKQSARIGKVYDRANDRAAGVKIRPLQAVSFLDEQITRFKDAPEGEAIAAELTRVRDKIASGVSVSGMRDARTILSQGVHNGKLRSSLEKGIYKQFLGKLSGDIDAGLTAAGRNDARNLFRIADKAWSERIDYIDNVLEPVIGAKKSGEQVLESIEKMAGSKGGNNKRLSELLRELPAEESGNVRATIIDRLGKATAGNQNADGTAFSASTFLTRWNTMSGKGKAVLFGNTELRQSLDRIAKVSEAVKETGKAASHSNTPAGIGANMGGLVGVGAFSPKIAALIGSTQLITGRLMASPKFASWLAKVPADPKAMERHTGQLRQIAAREPLIANDIASIQQYLGTASQRAAAGSEDERP